MAGYVVPGVQVFQDFVSTPSALAFPLAAHIAGPNGQLIRYAQSAEKENGFLGFYDWINTEVYGWPQLPAGGINDQTYTALFVEDALLQYFNDNSTCTVSGTYSITSSSISFSADGSSYPASAELGDRGVVVGDIVKATFNVEPPVILWSYVAGLVPTEVPSSIANATEDIDNAPHSTNSASITQSNGPFNALHASVSNAVAYENYDPYPTGQVTETYRIVVISSSVGGNLSTATLRIISASGLDDVAALVPNDEGEYTPIGTHGLKVLFDASGGAASMSADVQDISPNDFIAGQQWTVTVHAAFTPVTATSNFGSHTGVYTGNQNTTYQVTVVQGGKFGSSDALPQVSITTTTGYDVSGPTTVPAAGSNITVGTHGVTAHFTGGGLAYGDRFYIQVTAQGAGPVNTISLGHTLPSTVPDGTPCDLQLFILEPSIQLPQNRTNEPPLTNFSMTATQLTVNYGATAYDPTWTFNGVPVALPVVSDSSQNYGRLYVQTRTWLPNLIGAINGINNTADIATAIPGPLDPDNPLAWGVYKALANANGNTVYYTAVADPTQIADWQSVLDTINGSDLIYGLVPLTSNPAVQALWQSFINDASTPTNAQWCNGWFQLSDLPTIPIVSAGSTITGYSVATTTNGEVALATITAAPNVSPVQYTVLTVTTGNAAFITNGVVAGDIVRAVYTGDGFGGTTYQEFVVATVATNDTLTLTAGPGAAVNIASKIEVWRNLNATQDAAAIAKVAGAFNDRRIKAVWPDVVGDAGTNFAGYFLCAALAGLASGIVPQQGMTNLAIAGFDDLSRTTAKFNTTQLNTMAGSGVWIVTQSTAGEVYTRHAVTTGPYTDINQREEMITRNVDSISYQFMDVLAPYIGVTNVVPATINQIKLQMLNLIQQLTTPASNPLLGGQLVDATIVSIQQNALLLDTINAVVNLDVPEPFNDMILTLVV